MRLRIAALAALFATTASAAMPLSGVYGDAPGCADYRGSDYIGEDWQDGVYVAPDRVVGPEWACYPSSVPSEDGLVNLLCAGEDGLIDPEVIPMAISERPDGSLIFEGRSLARCEEPTS